MAGGIFPGAPFAFNIKCIVFTALLAGGYWYLPPKKLFVLFFLLWFPYIAMAWYDYAYQCHGLKPTIVPFGRYMWLPFKPQDYQAEFTKLSDSQVRSMDRLDHLVGWSIVVSLTAWLVLRSKR
jgi:hypothetical protein